ncbi:MAG: DUF2027 domain-containing protein [Bacteroidota bacterium]
MNFKLGDRVSFLNDKGGGIVTKIVDENLVHVTIEDGFEIPVLTRELIKTGTAEMADEISRAHQNIIASRQESTYSEDMLPLYLSHNDPAQRPDGLYFCFIPEIQENPLSGSLEIHLINHTQWHNIFSLFLNHSGDYHGTEYGFIEPESRLHLATIGRSEIEKWANALWQCAFFKEDKCRPLPPFSGLVSFRPIKLYNEESFQFESLLRKKAFMIKVVLETELSARPLVEEKSNRENLRSWEEKLSPGAKTGAQLLKKTPQSFLEKHKIDDKIAEIDLHIGELVDNFTNLEKNDLLNIQLEYFRKCLAQAQKEKLTKVIFIHGVGNGILKSEINKQLDKTEGISYYDAPYARYGMGATEVHFYRNK